MRLFSFIFLLFSLTAQAAQVISTACINEVATKLEFRFTHNPDNGKIYAWERHLTPVWNTFWRSCFLYPISPGTLVEGYAISNVSSLGLRTVINPVNGRWFQTNAVGIEQDQQGLDWCTQ